MIFSNDHLLLVEALHQKLNISADYSEQRGLVLIPDCRNLVDAGLDVFSREAKMEASTHQAWLKMQESAQNEKVTLQLVSAYRSVNYQFNLLQNKLLAGQSLTEILKVNAAPGYSEHHSGQALDLSCPDFECLSENFDQSLAFAWLSKNAGLFGFSLSYPRGNAYGFLYEPWHWRFSNL